jgi:hypothetical protein
MDRTRRGSACEKPHLSKRCDMSPKVAKKLINMIKHWQEPYGFFTVLVRYQHAKDFIIIHGLIQRYNDEAAIF